MSSNRSTIGPTWQGAHGRPPLQEQTEGIPEATVHLPLSDPARRRPGRPPLTSASHPPAPARPSRDSSLPGGQG